MIKMGEKYKTYRMKEKIALLLFLCFPALVASAQGVGGNIYRPQRNSMDRWALKNTRTKVVVKHGRDKNLEVANLNFETYSPELKAEASKGNAKALYYLAKAYCFGNGVEVGKAKEKEFLFKSAEKGYPEALYCIGLDWLNGDNTTDHVDYDNTLLILT